MMKRILISAGTLVFVGALVVSATGAFFSDTETSTGNTFAAGAIDLLIDNTSYGFDWNDPTVEDPTGEWGPNAANSWQLSDLTNQLFFSFSDLKPGDFGEDTISLHVNDNDAYACMAFDLTATPENGLTEPETDFPDTTVGADEGELQNHLSFLFWNDDGDNVLEVGETVIDELSGLPGEIFTGGWLPIAEGGDTPLPGGSTNYVGKGWCFGAMTATPIAQDGVNTNPPDADTDRIGFTCDGAGDHNDAQTDGITVDVGFYATQSRNNGEFTCSDLPPFGGGEGPVGVVGAVLSAYVQPEGGACNVNVASTTPALDTIQEGVTAATAGQTVCVEAGTYNENVTIDEAGIVLAGDGASATSIINGFVQIEANNVTVKGFQITGGLTTAPAFAGVYILANTSGHTISNNLIDGTDAAGSTGILFGYDVSNTNVTNNVIRDWNPGSYINPTTAGGIVFTDNDFESNAVGIGSDGITNVDIMNNEFDGNTVESIGLGDFERNTTDVVITSNNFIPAGAGNDVNAYELNGAFEVAVTNATGNWWDSEAEAARTNDTATVDTEPAAGALLIHN